VPSPPVRVIPPPLASGFRSVILLPAHAPASRGSLIGRAVARGVIIPFFIDILMCLASGRSPRFLHRPYGRSRHLASRDSVQSFCYPPPYGAVSLVLEIYS